MGKRFHYKHNPIVRNIFMTMLMPTIFMNLTTAIASIADSIIIGCYLDDASLSVVTFAMPIFLVINTFSALFAVGGCIAMSIDAGRGDKIAANKAFSTAVILLGLVGGLLLVAGLFFSTIITGWLGAGKDVFDQVEIYSRIILLGGPIFTLNTGLAFFIRNDGRPTLSMVSMFSSIGVDICLNFLFVGFMGMGVAGAALSTVIGSSVGIAVSATHFFSRKNTLRFRPGIDGTILRVIKNGGSAGLQFIYQFVCVLIINHLLANLAGTNGVVIYTVVYNLATLSLSLFEGISQTIQPIISNYYGEKSYRNIKDTLRLAFFTILIICGSVTVFLEIFPSVVPMIFGISDAALIASSASAVRIYTCSMIVTTVNVVIGYYFQSTEKTYMAAFFISMRSLVIFLASTLILGKLFGINGIWGAYFVTEVITLGICILMIQIKRSSMKKKGIHANIFLLDKNVEKNITCYTYDCRSKDFDTYKNTVEANDDLTTYLSKLESCIVEKKRKVYRS